MWTVGFAGAGRGAAVRGDARRCGRCAAYIVRSLTTMPIIMKPIATFSQRHTFGLDSGPLSARAP